MLDKTVEWLLEEDNAPVRFAALTSLLGRPMDDPEVTSARDAMMRTGTVPEILAQQNTDGSWGVPERFYLNQYTGTVWTLLLLAELGPDPGDPQIRRACEFILQHSRDPEGGGFSYNESAKTHTELPSGVIPCLTGNMVYALIKMGYLDDDRVQKAIRWIIKYQRVDDADGGPPPGPPYDRYVMCWGRHQCHMGAAKALKALAVIPPDRRSPDCTRRIDEMAEYFLKHHIHRKSHNLDQVSRPGWLKLGFPLMYQTDVLELLDIFAQLSIRDPRLMDAVDVIRSKQMPDGKWRMESSNNGKMIVDIEAKGKPSKWITLKALRVLNTYR